MLELQATELSNYVRMPCWRILDVNIFPACLKYLHLVRVSGVLLCRFRFFSQQTGFSQKLARICIFGTVFARPYLLAQRLSQTL